METLQPKLRFPEFSGDWNESNIGEIGEVKMCKRIFNEQTTISGEIPFFKIGSFGKTADAFITKELYLEYRSKFSFPKKGDILISAAGTIGRTVIYDGSDAYYQDSNIVWIDNDNAKVTNEFLYFIFQIVKFNTEGGTIQRLYNNILKSTKFKKPSIVEQNKIANFLSLVETKINQLTQKKNLLEQYKKGVMQKIFTQEIRFKDDNGDDFPDWEEKKLGEICDVRDGTHDSPKYVESGYPFITSKNLLKNGKIDFENVNYINETDYIKVNQRSKVDINDILFGMIGTIGNPVLVNKGGFAIKNVALLKEKECLKNLYLIHFLKSDSINQQFFEQNTGGTQKFVSLSTVRNLIISFPSIEEQSKIANFLSAIDDQISQVSKQLEQTTQYKKGLLQQMFV